MSRKKLIIIIALGVLIIALLFVQWFRRRTTTPVESPNVGSVQQQTPGAPLNTNTSTPVSPKNTPPTTTQDDSRPTLQRQAAAFAERYGSFSNEGNYENILDLQPFMTQAMAARSRQYVATAKASTSKISTYSGTTTRALATSVTGYDEGRGSAAVLVKTQRREVAGQNAIERVYYQDMSLSFVKEGGVWKVDSVVWK